MSDGKDIDEHRIQRAVANWLGMPKGIGNDNFFKLGLECKRAGMSLNDIGALLREEISLAHSPTDVFRRFLVYCKVSGTDDEGKVISNKYFF
jgi:hypothetical protein